MSEITKRLKECQLKGQFLWPDECGKALREIERLKAEIEQWHKAHATYEQALAHLDIHD